MYTKDTRHILISTERKFLNMTANSRSIYWLIIYMGTLISVFCILSKLWESLQKQAVFQWIALQFQ